MTSSTSPLIIAVDDEADDLFFLRQIITKSGLDHRFQPFANGEATMVALTEYGRQDPPGEMPLVCFLDIKLIGMTGFELLKWIRQQKALEALPVIMFSSSDHPEDVDKARELGAQGYVTKYPSVGAMATLLAEAQDFANSAPPRKTFVQWHYRFITSRNPFSASLPASS
jgi:CheY-like chemotaxis protein